MSIQFYKRADLPYRYIAARLGGAFDPLPSWFQLLHNTGMLRYDDEHNVEVLTVTGVWRMVEQGDWVVLQQAGSHNGVRVVGAIVWHVEHEDFVKTWERV